MKVEFGLPSNLHFMHPLNSGTEKSFALHVTWLVFDRTSKSRESSMSSWTIHLFWKEYCLVLLSPLVTILGLSLKISPLPIYFACLLFLTFHKVSTFSPKLYNISSSFIQYCKSSPGYSIIIRTLPDA